MSKSNATETDVLNYFFNSVAFTYNAATQLTVHLHVGDPGEAGTSATSPATYTNYAPVDVARSGAGWTVAGNEASNAALIQFPQCGATGNTITHVSVTPKSSTQILYSGALNDPLNVANLIQPQFSAGNLKATED